LDPFAGEFVYKDKKLIFEGEIALEEFTSGLGDVINQTVEHYIAQDNAIVSAIYGNLQALKEERLQLIDRLKLDMKMPSVFGDTIPVVSEKKDGDDEPKEEEGGGFLSRFIGRRKSKADE